MDLRIHSKPSRVISILLKMPKPSQGNTNFISQYSSGKQKCSLYTSPTQVPATSDEDPTKSFVTQFFPLLLLSPHTPDTTHYTRSWAPLTREEVFEALKSCENNSAPGPSYVTYKAVKWAWEACSLTLRYLYSQCIELGYYPSPFKLSITAMASKSNKNNYTDPSSFRPIPLT